MKTSKRKQCVFCGKRPSAKTREHILPEWLLKLTGDPSRTATMGFNPNTGDPIRYAWSALTMPACDDCNNLYSALEGAARPIIKALLGRKSIDANGASVLLDWLDKVRVCLWLQQLVIQNRVDEIDPKLIVDNRIGTKDRLLSVYTLPGISDGLNAIGIESLLFLHQPSCFTLRINDIALFNASSDFAYSDRFGLPYPRMKMMFVDGPDKGAVAMSNWDFDVDATPKHPIVTFPLPEPDLQLVQPITHSPSGAVLQGKISQQHQDRVCILTTAKAVPRTHVHAQSRIREIAAATFRYQTEMFRAVEFVSDDPKAKEYAEGMSRILFNLNEFRAIQVERGLIQKGEPDQATLLFREAMEAARLPATRT